MEIVPMHEFMAQHREELESSVCRELQVSAPDANPADIAHRIHELIDEMIRALQREAGLPVSSPLPGASESARWLGRRRQARGYEITRIAEDLGAISTTTGELARREGVGFSGGDYKVFNQCIDTASAAALEQFWNQAREQREHDETERLGVVVHELRNTLASARLSFAVLKRGEVGVLSKTGEVLDRSLRHLESLIGEMVMAVQLGAGVIPELRRLSLAALIRQLMDAAVPERGIRLDAEIDESLQVDADEKLLTAAVSNLIQNAFKFTRSGGQIIVRAFAQKGSVVVEVEDECGGLPPGKHDELFAPFVSKAPARGGLGLGLTITRDAVEAHGGRASITDLPGKGCIFRLTFPASEPGGSTP